MCSTHQIGEIGEVMWGLMREQAECQEQACKEQMKWRDEMLAVQKGAIENQAASQNSLLSILHKGLLGTP
jgi:hypothetical protein